MCIRDRTVKALAEAEAYPGPSLVIAYAPCINHGIKKGMSKAQTEEKLAVEAGYWHNFRFNPAAENKFTLDSKAPTGDYQAFLKGEVRYASLALKNPERAAVLFEKNEEAAKERYAYLSKLVEMCIRDRRSAASPLTFPYGIRTTVSSVTSVPTFARTQLSVRLP